VLLVQWAFNPTLRQRLLRKLFGICSWEALPLLGPSVLPVSTGKPLLKLVFISAYLVLVLIWISKAVDQTTTLHLSTKSVPLLAVQARSKRSFPSQCTFFTRMAHRYYVTAAPQCVYPDSALSGVLNSANFDAIYGVYFLDA
jgi:hypothetical protein